MAGTSWQKPYVYLAPQQAITASAMATLSSANSRAFSDRVVPRSSATDLATRFHETGVLPFQKTAICVWSAVRVKLNLSPTIFTSLKSAAYWSLDKAGGPEGRNCDCEVSAQVVI